MTIKSIYRSLIKIIHSIKNLFRDDTEMDVDPFYEDARYIIRDHGKYSVVPLMRGLGVCHKRALRLHDTLISDRILEMNQKNFTTLVVSERMAKIYHLAGSIALLLAGVAILGSHFISDLYHCLKYNIEFQYYLFQSSNMFALFKALPLCVAGIAYKNGKHFSFYGSLSFLLGIYICSLPDRVFYFHDVSCFAETIILTALVLARFIDIDNLNYYISLLSGELLSILLTVVTTLYDKFFVDVVSRLLFCFYKVPFALFHVFLVLEKKAKMICVNLKKGN